MKALLVIAAIAAAGFSSCKNNDDMITPEVLTPGPNQVIVAINNNNELIKFNAQTPGTQISKVAITGVVAGEKLMSIDFRPATGELYALSSASKLYIINQNDASARVVSSTPFGTLIAGTIVSIDFNPTVDRLRVVSNTGQNLRINPENGVIAGVDGVINGGTSPAITGIAYTNSKAGATTTVLFDIDQVSGKLYRQEPPNNGTLVEVGSLGVSFTGNAAFDIITGDMALLAAGGTFYSVSLTTGKASKIGTTTEALIDIAVPTEAAAYTVDASGNLTIFNPTNIAAGVVTKTVSGLQPGETIHGIDFRPVNGQLYALGSTSRLYTVNLSSGAMTMVGVGPFATLLSGTDFGFDFNPTVDRIRIVSNTGQNLRIVPTDATVAGVDGVLNPGTPSISGAAYTNSFAGATTTTLFVIDHSTDKLYIQNPPNNGTLVEVGNLGVNITADNAFDISGRTNSAYLVATVGAATNFYTLNTTSGAAATPVVFPSVVKGFSIAPGF